MFLKGWHCKKLGLTDLPGHDGKVMSDNKIIFNSHQRPEGGNYCSHFSVILETTSKFLLFLSKADIGKNRGSRFYQTTMEDWYQVWIYFEGNIKGFRAQIEILSAIFDGIYKQQLNLLLFLLYRYYQKLGLTDLPGHDNKVTSDKKMIWKWFLNHIKGIEVEIETLAAIF